MAADVAQRESRNIKHYVSAFSNIYIYIYIYFNKIQKFVFAYIRVKKNEK